METEEVNLKALDEAHERVASTWQFQVTFHKGEIKRLRKGLGKECTYLSFETEGNKRFIKAVMKNNAGGKDTVSIEVPFDLSKFRKPEYNQIMKTLGTKSYDRSTETL